MSGGVMTIRVLRLFFLLALEPAGYLASTCNSDLLRCSRDMTIALSSLKDSTRLCSKMVEFFDCIQTSCNTSLTPCEMSKARMDISSALSCENTELPGYETLCNSAPSRSWYASWLYLMLLPAAVMLIPLQSCPERWRNVFFFSVTAT